MGEFTVERGKFKINLADFLGFSAKTLVCFGMNKLGFDSETAKTIGEGVENLVHGLSFSDGQSLLKTFTKAVDYVCQNNERELKEAGIDIKDFKEKLSYENLFRMLCKPDAKKEFFDIIKADKIESNNIDDIESFVDELVERFNKEMFSNPDLASTAGFVLGQYNYELLKKLTEQDNKTIEAYTELLKNFTEYAKNSRNKDTYEGLDFINKTIFPVVNQRLTYGCDDNILELAYFLTDIYDRVSENKKAVKFANQILKIINKKVEEKGIGILDKSKLRMLVGCYYSVIVKKSEKSEQRTIELENIKKQYEELDRLIESWNENSNVNEDDYLFLKGLFESDYGALYLNLYNDVSNNMDDLEKARKHHESAIKKRTELLENLSDYGESKEITDAKTRLIQSKSNLAEVYYFQEKYEMAISLHNEVLNFRIEQREKENDPKEKSKKNTGVINSKRYLAGCYLATWKLNVLDPDLKEKCQEYIEECISYYKEKNDTKRLKEMEEMEKEISILN